MNEKLMQQSCRVALAAYLHDVGKFAEGFDVIEGHLPGLLCRGIAGSDGLTFRRPHASRRPGRARGHDGMIWLPTASLPDRKMKAF
jgi:hypothetical protein